MADHAGEQHGGGDDIFIYRGGRAPQHITHVVIDKSVEVIDDNAFRDCICLVQVETHDGIRSFGDRSFFNCKALRRINLKSAVEIREGAFHRCENLEHVEFGDKLETISEGAFGRSSLRRLQLPFIIVIESLAFWNCWALTDIELSERLEKIGTRAFWYCHRLQRIAIPLKRDLFSLEPWLQRYSQFDKCEQLVTVDLVGGIHDTVASLHMECWRTEMIAKIDRINQYLPTTPAKEKTETIKHWMDSVINKMDHYKAEHHRYLKEATTLLELALWKAKLDEFDCSLEPEAKKAKIDAESARKERRFTSGADTVIKNVLGFLEKLK
jgi:hypothetical protein